MQLSNTTQTKKKKKRKTTSKTFIEVLVYNAEIFPAAGEKGNFLDVTFERNGENMFQKHHCEQNDF